MLWFMGSQRVGHNWATKLNWMARGFPYFLQFKSKFCNKELMILATISSWSSFCWLYRASPFSAAKNVINPISVLTIRWYPCVKSSLVLLEKGICYDQCVVLTKLLAFALLYFVFHRQICLLFHVSLNFLLLHSNYLWWKGCLFFLMLVLEGLIGLHRTIQLQFL